MEWKPEYVGLGILVLFLSMFPITAIRIAHSQEASVRFRRALVILVSCDFVLLVFGGFAVERYAAYSTWPPLAVWTGLALVGLTTVARWYSRSVSRAEFPEFFSKGNERHQWRSK